MVGPLKERHQVTPNEYRTLRERAGTQQGVAAKLGVDYRTIQRREYGQIKINREAEIALRFLASARRELAGLTPL